MIENFINSIRNIFAVPDLRKRVLFTLAMLAVYRLGSHVRTPGIDPDALALLWNIRCAAEQPCKCPRPVFRRQLQGRINLCAGNHSVHNCFDHSSVDDRGEPTSQSAPGRGRTWPAQNHAVHTVSHGSAVRGPVVWNCVLAAEPANLGADRWCPIRDLRLLRLRC